MAALVGVALWIAHGSLEHRFFTVFNDWREARAGAFSESIPVKEVFSGETVLDGIAEVFHLTGHPKTDTVYAWMNDSDNPEKPIRHVAVLRIHPALFPVAAVRAFIVQEFRNAQAEA